MSKIVGNIKEVIRLCGLKDGMTVSFNHHLRDGDYVSTMVMEAIAELGYKDITVAMSALLTPQQSFIPLIEKGVITKLETGGTKGKLPEFISHGNMKEPLIFRTHGGRASAIERGDIKIDIAFVAASSSDCQGNCNGVYGKSAFGSIGYSMPDAEYANKVVVITDLIVDYPNTHIGINETKVDYVVKVDQIGDPNKIVSTTTKITKDPIKLLIAQNAAKAINASGLLENGFSFQTGAGGVSLAAAAYIKEMMQMKNVKGSFLLGGITKYMVDLLEGGYFKSILDVQCFDLEAVRSIRENINHHEISASQYANYFAKSCATDNLDVVILGATEIDSNFNVNVHTDSNGMIMGGSGGHSDTAQGSKLSIIVTPLIRSRLPIIVDQVKTISTPGNTIDMIVTERGMAVNPKNIELKQRLIDAGLNVLEIEELKSIAEKRAGKPKPCTMGEKIVGKVIYRDGNEIDVIREVKR